ncbi:MAG: heme ABC transporter permease [Deltaproteobacteria bacterium]|nr:heme ABC transporter permease [Deltaproteobacteria bacterium]
MAAYHVVLVHFPIALWMTATLAILWRVVSDGPLAKAVDRALVPLLVLGLLAGLAAYVVGLMVWPWETISSTPLGRNHMLLATWTVAYWALLLATRWIQGEAVWQSPMLRWTMAGLAILGSVLLGITGTLGGHLVGIYTEVSAALRLLGWEVYTTFYVPTLTLATIGVVTLLLIGLGLWGRTARTAD